MSSIIQSAALRLHNWDDGAATQGPTTLHAYRVTEEWRELDAGKAADWYDRTKKEKWSTPGGTYDAGWSAVVGFDSSDAPQWVEWDLTPLVQEWLDGVSPNHGVLLIPSAGSAFANFRSANFADSAVHPQLTVTYTQPVQPL